MKKRICIIFLVFLIVLMPVSMALTYKDSLEVHNYKINKVECSDNYLRVLVKSETTKNLLLMFKVYSNKGNINIYTNQRLNKFNKDYFLVNTNLKCNSLLRVDVNGYADIKLKNKDSERIIYINYEPGYQFNYKENKIPSSLLPVIETQVTNEYASYVYLGSKLIYSKNTVNEELYYMQDSLNSNSIAVNSNGNLVSLQDYEPYGNNIELNPYTDTRYKFTGKELDKNSDLYYFGARYYDPGIGRFITNDRVFNPAITPYAYANNNPIKFIDPDGNFATSGYVAGRHVPNFYSPQKAPKYLQQELSSFLDNNLQGITDEISAMLGKKIQKPNVILGGLEPQGVGCEEIVACSGNVISLNILPVKLTSIKSFGEIFDILFGKKKIESLDEIRVAAYIKHGLLHQNVNAASELTKANLGEMLVKEGIAWYIQVADRPDVHYKDNFGGSYFQIFTIQNHREPFKSRNQADYFIEAGYHLVAPIADKYGALGIKWMIANPPTGPELEYVLLPTYLQRYPGQTYYQRRAEREIEKKR